MKVLFVVLDGLGDRPAPDLDYKTPLEAARTPNLDRLASLGICGLLTPLSPGVSVGSPTAHFSLFGYREEEFPGRAVFMAVARGLDFGSQEVVSAARFATVERDAQGLMIIERIMQYEEDHVRVLAEVIKEKAVNDIAFKLVYTGLSEGILLMERAVSEHICDCDPLGKDLPVIKVQAMDGAPDPQRAAETASALNQYLRWAHHMLQDHPINRKRRAEGLLPINFLLAKWTGRRKSLEPFSERFGFRAATLCSEEVLIGLALEIGLEVIPFEEREDAEEDLRARLLYARELFDRGYDFLHVHTKEPDAVSHYANPPRKKAMIESLDRSFDCLLSTHLPDPEVLMVISSDHSSPSSVSGPYLPGAFHDQHSGEPVPIAILGRYVRSDGVMEFHERSVASGGLGHIRGSDFMNIILSLSGRTNTFGWKPTRKNILYRPRKIEAFEP